MNQYEKQLRERLHHVDLETVEELAAQFPAADDAAKERIYQRIRKGQQAVPAAEVTAEPVAIVQHKRYRGIWTSAACLLLCGSLVGAAAFHHPSLTAQQTAPDSQSDTAETEDHAATAQRIEQKNPWIPKEYTIGLPEPETVLEVPEELATTAAAETEPPSAETEPLPAVIETQPNPTDPPAPPETTEPPEVPETQPPTQPPAETQPPIVERTWNFVSMADALPTIPGFMVTSQYNEWGKQCVIKPTDSERKGDIQTRYRPAYLPAGWVRDAEAGTDDAYFERMTGLGHRWYNYDTYYEMEAGGSPQTTSYLIVAQSVQDLELWCRQDYVIGNNGIEQAKDPSLYAYAVTTVGNHPAFMYRESRPNGDGTYSIWYTLYWEQDGYLCSVYLADVPESYLTELVNIAESLQPLAKC